jgi:uncharacterized CHY-type Zn-finger protein
MNLKGIEVRGSVLDDETRCSHYHSDKDRIAIRFYCCGIYYPCYQCHEEQGCGYPQVWPKESFNKKGILCGSCKEELTIEEYLVCHSVCPKCQAEFNPGCSLHKHLYFEVL